MDIKVIGSLDAKFESTNRIYDVGGCCPTLSTMQGGNQEPKILEVKRLGGLYGNHQMGSVYDKNYLSPTIDTMLGGNRQPIIVENPKQLGFMDNGTGKHQSNIVYDENGISPSITTIDGGTQQIKVATANAIRMVRTEEGKKLRKQYESHEIHHGFNEFREPELKTDGCSNAITTVQKDNLVLETVRIKQATKKGYIECELGGVADFSYPTSKLRRGRVQGGGQICPTLTANSQEIYKIDKEVNNNMDCKKVGQISNDGSQYGTVLSDQGINAALQAGTHGYANNCISTEYKIRKLTPKECWRLMGFSDSDYNKAAEVNSNTQLYKQAGNSIVKNVLIAIFSQLNIQGIKPWNERTIEEKENVCNGV